MEKSYITMYVQVFFVPMHLFWCIFYVHYLGYGFIGVAYAINTTAVLSFLSILLVIKL